MLKDNLDNFIQSFFSQIKLSKGYSMLLDNTFQTCLMTSDNHLEWLSMLSDNSTQITFIVITEIIQGQN